MGVKGLWKLLLPIGRRISLETLEGQVLAIDASIWLTQFLKALRDPQTGQSQPAAHLIGFVRRLCRLHFHGIRAVLVFDGPTPEIKNRELQNRRRRREQFSQLASDAGVQRLARRILAQELQKGKPGSPLKKALKKGKGSAAASNGMAAGFNPGKQASTTVSATSSSRGHNLKDPPTNSQHTSISESENVKKVSVEDEAAIIAAIREDLEAEEEKEKRAKALNDWDDAIIVDETVDEEAHKSDDAKEEQVEYEDFGLKQAKIRFKKQIDMDYISSLAPDKRKDAIEEAKREQRLQSRRQFIPAAANPDRFSSVQLQNFLKSSKFNLSIQKMAKEEVKRTNTHGGDLMASDRTTRISLIREDEEKKTNESDDDRSENFEEDPLFQKRPKKRQRLLQLAKDDTSDEEDQIDWENGADSKRSENRFSDTPSRRRRIFTDDDSDDHDTNNKHQNQNSRKKDNTGSHSTKTGHTISHLDQGVGFLSRDDGGGGGGFLPSPPDPVAKQSKGRGPVARSQQNMIYLDNDSSSGDDASSGPGAGGFLVKKKQSSDNSEIVEMIKEQREGGKMCSQATQSDAALAQEMADAILAEALQQEQYSNNQPTLKAPSTKTDELITLVDDDSSEGDIAWIEGGAKTKTALETSGFTPQEGEEDGGSDEDIDWEEGDKTDENMHISLMPPSRNSGMDVIRIEEGKGNNQTIERKPSPQQYTIGLTQKTITSQRQAQRESIECPPPKDAVKLDQVLEIESHRREKQRNVESSDGEDSGSENDVRNRNQWNAEAVDDWDVKSDMSPSRSSNRIPHTAESSSPSKSADESAAAFARAEATAANLASWAGRAFRRAMRETENEGFEKESAKQRNLVGPTEEQSTSKGTEQGTSNTVVGPQNDDGNKSVDTKQASPQRNDTIKETQQRDSQEEASKGEITPATNQFLISPDSQRKQDRESMAAMLRGNEELWAKERNQRERDVDTVTDEMKEEAMLLLRLFGVPYVESPAEAEAQCAALEQLGLVDGIVTEDSDVFVFGGKKVYKNIFDERMYAEAYMADAAEREMGLGRNAMVALAMLLGSDYTEGVKGVGIVNAMEVLKAFDVSQDLKEGLQSFRTWLDGFDPSDLGLQNDDSDEVTPLKAFHAKHRTARSRWVAPENFPADNVINAFTNPVVDKSTDKFSWGTPDVEGLVAFCSRYIGWHEDDTRRMLEPVVNRPETRYRQTRLDSFMRYEDGIKFADIKSQRLRAVLGLQSNTKMNENQRRETK